MDGGIRFGNGVISEILAKLIQAVLQPGSTVIIHKDMKAFVKEYNSGMCDIPVIIFNPEIDEMNGIWPHILSNSTYTGTPFFFINNPLIDDLDGARRLKPYIRNGFDFRLGMPFSVTELTETMRGLIERRVEVLT